MGDRASISFSNIYDGWKERVLSPVLFSHWGGMGFVNEAYAYVRRLKKEVKGKACLPLERLEPGTVMVDFIRHYTTLVITAQKRRKEAIEKQGGKSVYLESYPERITSDLYLGRTENDGDNSDNGHHEIKLDEVK